MPGLLEHFEPYRVGLPHKVTFMPIILTSLLATFTVDDGSGALTVLAAMLAQAAGETATTFIEVIADLRHLIFI